MRTRVLYGVFAALLIGYFAYVAVTRDPSKASRPRGKVGLALSLLGATGPAPGSRSGRLLCVGSLPHAPAERPKVATTKMGQQVAARLDARLNVQLQDSLNEDQRDLALYSRLIGEVGVNGFHGMFTNTLGNKALRTREAIVRMGPPELLAVYDCALTAFPSSTPHQRSDKRFDELRAWSEPGLFRELDQRVSDLTASHELDKAMDDYVSRHPAL